MTQFMRPTGTPTTVGWTGSAADVADSGGVNDATFIESPLSPTATSYWDCALSGVTDPNTDEGLVLRFRPVLSLPGGDAKQITVDLYRVADMVPVVSRTVAVEGMVGEVAVALTPGQAALVSSYASGALRVRVTAAPAAKAVVQQSDFTYLGAFAVANTYSIDGADPGFAAGLTHRYRGGAIELFTHLWGGTAGGTVVAMRVPELRTSNYLRATDYVRWANPYNSKRFDDVVGLFWDEEDQRLYWNCVNGYNTSGSYPSFGYSVLNDTNQTATAFGPYYLPTPPNYKPIKGMCALPGRVAATLGKRLAFGFGSYESIMATGQASLGPTLVAFDPAALSGLADNSVVSSLALQVLMNHPYNATPYTSPWRATRPPDYVQAFDGWAARAGVGYWTWVDYMRQAGVWIDTPTKSGFLVLPRMTGGGETAVIQGAVANAVRGTFGYDLTLAAPLANVRLNDIIMCPLSPGGVGDTGAATVKHIAGATLGVDLIPSGYYPSPAPAVGGTVYRGAWYYNSTLRSTTGSVRAFIYAESDLLGGLPPDQVPYRSTWAWDVPTLQNPFPSWADEGPGVVRGLTFDAVTRRLYVLVANCYAGLGTAANSMVFVYQVS